MENTNLIMNSKNAWANIRRLGQTMSPLPLSNGRVEHRMPPGEHHKISVPSNSQPFTELTKRFSLDVPATGLSLLKPGKAAGLDYLLTKMLQHLGNKAKYWLMDMLNECTRRKHITSIWRKANVIVIPKPGKDSSPKSYRRISLQCIPYKLDVRLILMRQTWSFMCWSAPQLDSAHRRRIRKKYVNRSRICRPVSCIRHISTPTNNKKAGRHGWRHRYMPGVSWPPQQSPLLCTAT